MFSKLASSIVGNPVAQNGLALGRLADDCMDFTLVSEDGDRRAGGEPLPAGDNVASAFAAFDRQFVARDEFGTQWRLQRVVGFVIAVANDGQRQGRRGRLLIDGYHAVEAVVDGRERDLLLLNNGVKLRGRASTQHLDGDIGRQAQEQGVDDSLRAEIAAAAAVAAAVGFKRVLHRFLEDELLRLFLFVAQCNASRLRENC